MTEIKVMSIQDLLHIPDLKNSTDYIIVFITTKPDYYNFGYTRFYHFNIADTDMPVIKKVDIKKIQDICNCGKYYKIYVCCDAGLSRSPAVAHFLAVKLHEFKQAEEIEKKYRFLNQALYKKLMETI